jgi:anaerobic magnesium-protoporphyrin IX monomethyl ester cyclase
MADITLCNFSVPVNSEIYGERKKFITVPLGPLYLTSYSEKNGYNIDFRDYQMKDSGDPYDPENLSSFLEDSSDVLGFSSLSSHLPYLIIALKKMKKEHPEKTMILGGYGPSDVAEEIIKQFKFVDVVVKGEGEKTLVELLDCLEKGKDLEEVKGIVYRDEGRVRTTPQRERIENLDELPFPAYNKIDIHKYNEIGVISSRGCCYACTFCDVSPMWQGRVTYRSLDNFVDEIKLLYEKYQIRNIRIFDNVFPIQNIERFCDILKKEELDIKWTCYSRINLINKHLLKKMGDAGCYGVFYGVESGSNKILRRIGKKFTAEQAERIILESKKYIKGVLASFIFGFPFETFNDFMKTYNLANKFLKHNVEVLFFYLGPLPNSKLSHDYKDTLQFDPEFISPQSLPLDPLLISKERNEILDYIKKYPTVFPDFYHFPSPDLIKKKKLYGKFYIACFGEEWLPLRPYLFEENYLIFSDEDGRYYELNKTKNNEILSENPYIEIEISKCNLQNLYTKIVELKPEVALLHFKIKASDLKVTNGRKITEFLSKLRESKINFKVACSLPRCIFSLEDIQTAKNLGVSTSCEGCLQLVKVKRYSVDLCKFVKDDLNRTQYDFPHLRRDFYSFYNEDAKHPVYRECRNCIFRLRKQCTCYNCI